MDLFSPFAFGAGMVALINPCGFALLPAYLGFFLGQKDEEKSRIVSLNRAQGVGLALSLGIMVVFGTVGIILGGLQSWLAEFLPYFNIVLGFALIGLGIAMLFGFQLMVKIPKLQKGGGDGSFTSMFLFGVSYAIASLSCTIGVFISAVGSTSTNGDGGFFHSLGGFLSYGLGMGLLATVLTLLMALGKRELVNKFRTILPKINIISAVLLLIVGPYMVGYGIWEIQILGSGEVWGWLDSIMARAGTIQSSMNTWFAQPQTVFGRTMSRTAFLGWPFVAVNLALIAAGFVIRKSRRDDDDIDVSGADVEMADA
jgi:cytochrome c-type biogenesis protein